MSSKISLNAANIGPSDTTVCQTVVCCSLLQYAIVCCSILQYSVLFCSMLWYVVVYCTLYCSKQNQIQSTVHVFLQQQAFKKKKKHVLFMMEYCRMTLFIKCPWQNLKNFFCWLFLRQHTVCLTCWLSKQQLWLPLLPPFLPLPKNKCIRTSMTNTYTVGVHWSDINLSFYLFGGIQLQSEFEVNLYCMQSFAGLPSLQNLVTANRNLVIYFVPRLPVASLNVPTVSTLYNCTLKILIYYIYMKGR